MSFPNEVDKIQTYFSTDNSANKVRENVAEGIEVPLYILESSTDSAHLAAKKGLPYAFASHFSTTHIMNALDIYRSEFKPSSVLDKPYTMAGVNIIVADTDEAAERISTSLYERVIGILTGERKCMQPPVDMTDEVPNLSQYPAVQ
jgi:alkanesulfonate monooxygenase SsuD/methylene tetrahydromethanopterin reductase-like flavin-dependent oxidoreductase (luciferase family)